MTRRRYYDQKDDSSVTIDSDGADDNCVLVSVCGVTIELNRLQVANLIDFLQGNSQTPTPKVLWVDE